MAAALHRVRVDPGQVLSLWRCAGRPSARRGYLPGVVLVDGRIVIGEGGSTCLLSTVLYNAGLLAGLDVVERHAHSTDVYGASRYYELGRDATILYGVLDLRFRNPYPFAVLLDVAVDDARVAAAFRAPRARSARRGDQRRRAGRCRARSGVRCARPSAARPHSARDHTAGRRAS